MQYLEDGAILQTEDSCDQGLDGTCIPTRDRHGGANYFDRESQIMHVVNIVLYDYTPYAALTSSICFLLDHKRQ